MALLLERDSTPVRGCGSVKHSIADKPVSEDQAHRFGPGDAHLLINEFIDGREHIRRDAQHDCGGVRLGPSTRFLDIIYCGYHGFLISENMTQRKEGEMSAETVLKDFAKEIAFPPDVPNGIMYNAGCNAMAAAAVQALADKGLSVLPTATIDTLVAALDTMIAWANGAPGGYPGSEVEAALALARKVSP